MKVSVIIPTYNEEENIGDLIREVDSQLSRESEVIVVDGDSTDSTRRIVESMQEDTGGLQLIRKTSREGIGAAYRRGFEEAEGEVVVQMDADFSHPPEKIPELVSEIQRGADVAVGSRYVKGGERKDPLLRRISPLIGSYLYRFGLGSPVKDVTSGFKAYSREVAEELSSRDLPDGFHFQAASLMGLVEEGRSIVEVPIRFGPRRAGNPKYSFRDLLMNVGLLLELFLKRREKILKFGLVGASGVLVNMGVLYFLTEHLGLYYLFSAVFAAESAIVSNFTLNELWTFAERGREGIRNVFKRFFKFNSISAAGVGINVAVLWFLTEVFGLYYLVSNLFAIAVVFLWNFTANVKWTWRE